MFRKYTTQGEKFFSIPGHDGAEKLAFLRSILRVAWLVSWFLVSEKIDAIERILFDSSSPEEHHPQPFQNRWS